MAVLLHHPAFESLLLPALLSWLGVWLLLRLAGPRWAVLGGVAALLLALAVMPGYVWPATARAAKLPWAVLAAALLAALAHRQGWHQSSTGRLGLWGAAALLWAAVQVWLGGPPWPTMALGVLAGASLLALLLLPANRGRGVVPSAITVILLLAMAALAGTGGSLLLAQLVLLAASAGAVPGLWAWWRPASGLQVPRAALLPFAIAGLVVAASLPTLSNPGAAAADAGADDAYYAPQWK
ncbi:hypothetical protein [Hydrogenophaga palleronii]|uniref:hypothetical protein n=1 Tax=Hydrogenophaga palleronii TaxID=65655 RepID=UPI000825C9A9|nr:hypothetical protein [Hydrogenophaga palleronii]